MINIPALFGVLRVGSTAADKRAWATKAAAYATLSGLLMALLPFVPPDYTQFINADWVSNACGTVITLAAAFGVFGVTNAGVLPAKPESVDKPTDNGSNDVSGGA